MIEKVNPSHPDKLADRIAGAIVDMAYVENDNPRVAVEVLLGHEECFVVGETSENLSEDSIVRAIHRIAGDNIHPNILLAPQDKHLADNQTEKIRCGDNGIFKGVPLTQEQKHISSLARALYRDCPYDGKFILNWNKLIICQSNADTEEFKSLFSDATVNPLGNWSGGTDVDTGATNRKLGSDMADAVTGGGLHGKDLSKADVSVNIYAFLKAQEKYTSVEISCAIGDEKVDGKPYSEIVEIARKYIQSVGGFEKFAE